MALSLINGKAIPAPPWKFTDDTMMAISIVSTLEEQGEINQDYLAARFARNYDSTPGYVQRCTDYWTVSGKDTGEAKRGACLVGRVPLATARRCAWLRWVPISPTILTWSLSRPKDLP